MALNLVDIVKFYIPLVVVGTTSNVYFFKMPISAIVSSHEIDAHSGEVIPSLAEAFTKAIV